MKLSDYVVKYIEDLGVKDIFLVSGGGNMHLVDSVGRNKNIRYICNHHEQACAVAAEGYARMKNDISVTFVTTGPGGTNAISGVAGCWLDSIPSLTISGQVKISNTIHYNNPKLRQFGDQELDIIEMVKSVTKYAVMITDKNTIRYHLDKAVYFAKTGRPGPVWIDIPLDIQASEINVEELQGFDIDDEANKFNINDNVEKVIDLLKSSSRPIVVAGNGIRLSHGEVDFLELLDMMQIPVVTAINGNDLVNEDYPYYTGRFGIMGQRGANFAIQNSDLILSIGSRLMLRQIGFDYDKFAREAKIINVDIDKEELSKPSIKCALPINSDARIFINKLKEKLNDKGIKSFYNPEWTARCIDWKQRYGGIEDVHREQDKYINSYYFVDKLSNYLEKDDHIITSNGTSNVSTLFAIKLKKGQRLFTNTGFASMGYGLPAAIGACIANNRKQVICMENDGSLQMNIQELQTVVHYNLPMKIFVFNNDGYLSIKNTQSAYFPDNITAADPSSGVSLPDLEKIAFAYGIPFIRINNANEIDEKLEKVFNKQGYFICEIMMDPWQILLPKTSSKKEADGRMVSKPIEDMYPFLPREEFLKNMIVKPLE